MVLMKKEKLLELSKKGLDFSFIVPAGTSVNSINQGIALFLIESAKYRGIKPSTAVREIEQWVRQLEDNL
jgi:hypothetical protein